MGASPHALGIAAGIFLACGGAWAASSDTPPLPYIDKGACPFECCTYRDWTTNAPVDARAEPNAKSPVVFHLAKNTPVTGVTGQTVTDRYGVTHMLQNVPAGYDPKTKKEQVILRAGDDVYTLHHDGEGYDMFWYKGKTYEDQIDLSGGQTSPGYKLISQPHYVWWVKIKTKDGRTGWTDQTKRFDNMDACG